MKHYFSGGSSIFAIDGGITKASPWLIGKFCLSKRGGWFGYYEDEIMLIGLNKVKKKKIS